MLGVAVVEVRGTLAGSLLSEGLRPVHVCVCMYVLCVYECLYGVVTEVRGTLAGSLPSEGLGTEHVCMYVCMCYACMSVCMAL